MQFSVDVRTARAIATAQKLAGGELCIRTGAMPLTCDGGMKGEEIATFELPANMTVKDGKIAAVTAPVRALAKINGRPGHWCVCKDGKCIAQGPVGKGFPIPAAEILQGQMIEIQSWVISEGNE